MERSSGAAPPRFSRGVAETDAGAGQLLDVKVERPDVGACVISVVGELDLSTLPSLERELLSELRGDGGVIVDLTEVCFIDSSGIGLLIQAFRASGDDKPLHTVIASGSQVERVFALAGIDRVLRLFGSREAAIGALDHRPAA